MVNINEILCGVGYWEGGLRLQGAAQYIEKVPCTRVWYGFSRRHTALLMRSVFSRMIVTDVFLFSFFL